MEIRQYIRIIIKRWWLIVLLALVATSTAAYNNYRRGPVYRSSVTLLLNPALDQSSMLTSASNRTSQLARTYALYLRTTAFADRVIQREGLNITPGTLVRSIDARIVDGTAYFEITASSKNPQDAQRLATVIANNFIAENLTQQQQLQAARRAASLDSVQILLRDKLERERQNYDAEVTALRASIDQIQSQPASTSRDQLLADAQEQLSQYEDRLLKVMTDQVTLQPAGSSSDINTVSIIEPAPLPLLPANSASNVQSVLYALVASLIVGVGLAFGLEYLDYTVRNPEELEGLCGKPVLAVFSREGNGNGAPFAQGIIALDDTRSALAEGFRVLRTNVSFSSAGQALHSLLITSACPGEGKSFVAANLAVVMAQAGKRVILVDADLRRPAVHRRFGLARTPGLGDLVLADNPADPATLQNYLQPGPVDNLRILTCGITTPNPAELLTFEHTHRILDALEALADIVIYDTPPALTVTDAVILAGRSDAILQVVHAGATRRDVVLRARDVLQRAGGRVLGPVLNMVGQGDVGYYHDYYYYGGHYSEPDSDGTRSGDRSGERAGRNGHERRPHLRRNVATPRPQHE